MAFALDQLDRPIAAWIRSGTTNNPLQFVTETLGAVPEPWQIEALNRLATEDRISIRSGHGVGKTTFFAWVILWFISTRYPVKIGVIANTQDQLRDTIWPEIRKWRDRLPKIIREAIQVDAERVVLVEAPASFATARTASKDNPVALQGLHEEHMLILIDEASGVPDIVFEVGQGALSTPGAKIVMASNPTRSEGFFYDTHHALRDRWSCMHVSCEDVPRARGHIEDIVAKYGRDSNVYRVRVLGEFPVGEDDKVIPLHLCESAVHRTVKPIATLWPVWGVDVARFGDDRNALAKRQGNAQMGKVVTWHGVDTMVTVGKIMAAYRETQQVAPNDLPSEILVDVIGYGAGVVDRLRELGLPVRGINVAETPAVSERYNRLRDELWWKAREWLEARDSVLADDPALIAELTSPKYTMTSTGKIKVESKDEMKKRGQRSPDLADAFCLTLAGGLSQREEHTLDPYRRRRAGGGGYMSA